jgi:hypothetical protein
MKPSSIIVLVMFLAISVSALAQTPKTEVTAVHLGDQVVAIPAPDGFEEVASQFEVIKNRFTATEAAENDMLTIHMPHADCEKLRAGELVPFNFYTKVSVRRPIREENYSPARFAELVAMFRKNGTEIMNINGPTMRGIIDRLDKSLSELNKQDTEVDLSQPVSLGEIDTRPNVFAVMVLMSITAKTGEKQSVFPIVGGLTFLRVKERLIYVYTYRRYTSKTDVEILRDFTKQWLTQILAAN